MTSVFVDFRSFPDARAAAPLARDPEPIKDFSRRVCDPH